MSAPATLAQPSYVKVRELRCANCLTISPEHTFRYGCCRAHGQHREHRYCPTCGGSIDWYGYVEVTR